MTSERVSASPALGGRDSDPAEAGQFTPSRRVRASAVSGLTAADNAEMRSAVSKDNARLFLPIALTAGIKRPLDLRSITTFRDHLQIYQGKRTNRHAQNDRKSVPNGLQCSCQFSLHEYRDMGALDNKSLSR